MRANHSNAPEPSTRGTLVVLDPDAPETTLRKVVPDAAVDEPLYLLVVYPDSEYERRQRAHAKTGVTAGCGVHGLADEAHRIAERVGERCLGPDADIEAIGAVGRRRERIAETVEEHGIELVCVPEMNGIHALRERVRSVLGLSPALSRVLPEGVTVVPAEDHGEGIPRTGTSVPTDG